MKKIRAGNEADLNHSSKDWQKLVTKQTGFDEQVFRPHKKGSTQCERITLN